MRIVFMGTPDYSVKTLDAVCRAGHTVAAVFSQPDKPQGRKQILTPPPVKVFAENLGIPVYQPTSLKDEKVFDILKKISPDMIVVVAYGKILPPDILKLPKFGCVNAHASLLPKYRGASPIQWAIISGEKKTGITTMLMDEGMDTGDILLSEVAEILPDETAEQLFSRLSEISADLTVKTIDAIGEGAIHPKKQDDSKATYAPVIKKEMAHIDFCKTADEVCCAVRGFYSWPCAFFMLDGKRIKVIDAKPAYSTTQLPGTVIESDGRLVISCGKNTSVELVTVQPEGSKQMSARQMLCGRKIPLGAKVE